MSIRTVGPRARQAHAEQMVRRHRAARSRAVVASVALTVLGTMLAVYALPAFIIIYGGMVPALIAFLVDERPGRNLFWTVAAINLAAIIPQIRPTWEARAMADAGLSPIADMQTWLVIYGAAFAGWAAAIGLPVIANFVLEVVIRSRIRRLEEARSMLAREWGFGGND